MTALPHISALDVVLSYHRAWTSGDIDSAMTPAAEYFTVQDGAIAEMGAGRAMGPSWLNVAADLTATDDQLHFWLDVAMEFNHQTADGPGRRRSPTPRDANM